MLAAVRDIRGEAGADAVARRVVVVSPDSHFLSVPNFDL
jgi:hypothetical protein